MTSVRWICVKVGHFMLSNSKTKPSPLWLMSLVRPGLIKKPSVADAIISRMGPRLHRLLVMQPGSRGANIRSLNKGSLRTLKGNKAQGAAVAVCVYLDREQYKIQKKRSSHMKRREKATGDRTVILGGVRFCPHHKNMQSCYKLCTGQKSNTSYVLPEMGTPETISQTPTLCYQLGFDCSNSFVTPLAFTSFHWLVWNLKSKPEQRLVIRYAGLKTQEHFTDFTHGTGDDIKQV